ncbi:hypothetical protein H0H87_002991 [Tephrocybe sp. NHM501043]|nr:hypothetical protein H0H87_002991 [Tephrocybe sp. NHM501043]
MAPTFMLAANFVIFGRIIQKLGTSYSRLPPNWYSIIFITADVISLIIQGTGGGLASVHIKTNPKPGGHVMLGGIAFQLLIIIVYTCLATEFFVRFSLNKPFKRGGSSESLTIPKPMSGKLRLMSFGLIFSTLCLFIRSVYRLIELADGWTGRIIRTEIYFNVLDGAMVTLAIFSLNFIHPGFLLNEAEDSAEKTEIN